MDTHELLQKITALPIIANGFAEDLLAGNFNSIFKGHGLEFDEARHYQYGDDARAIDWNASARFGTPFVKLYREERELTIMLLLDVSASMFRQGWGAGVLSPYEQSMLTAALVAFSTERTGQRFGSLLFDCGIERVFPPRKGRAHIMTFLSCALQYQSGASRPLREKTAGFGSNLRAALAGAGRLLKRRSMIFILSDFFSMGWEEELNRLCRRHDVIAIRIAGTENSEIGGLGWVTMEDPETYSRIEAPAGFSSFQKAWADWHKDRSDLWMSLCRRAGASHLEISPNTDAAAALMHFFSAGRKGQRHGE
jgi:uncharacterized protein (DUF58 family)